MPLLGYFGTMGAVLIAVLLFASFILEPRRIEGSLPNSAVEANLPRPRILSRVEQYSASARTAPSMQAGHGSSDPVSAAVRETLVQSAPSRDAIEPAPVQPAKARNNTARGAAWRQNRLDPGYLSYAQDKRGYAQERARAQSAAEGTLGPH
jgi:hypothetical protein